MFLFKKVLEAVLFPPGVIVAALLIIAFLSIFTKKGKSIFIISLFMAVTLYWASVRPGARILVSPLQGAVPRPGRINAGKGDAIAVLSAGAYNQRTLDGDTFNRLFAAYLLQKKYRIPVIVSGGKAGSGIAVSAVMERVLEEMGVKKGSIIVEDKSDDTLQNAKYILKIYRAEKFHRLILVTSAYHMPRSLLLFKMAGFKMRNVIPYPADYKTRKAVRYNAYDYLPDVGSLALSAEALHEYAGYLYYAIRQHV